MSGWAGLAAGANMYVQIKQEDKKNALLERLEKQKEDREQAIKIADENRAQAREDKKVHSTETIQVGGKYVTQDKNANGDVIRSEDADPDTIEKLTNAKTQDKLTLANLQATSTLNDKKLADYDADHSLENQVKQAQVGELNRHFNPSYGYGAGRPGKAPSYTAPTRGSLEAAFGGAPDDKGKVHVDQKQAVKFSQWRAAHQDIPDGDQALDAYMADMASDKQYKQGLVRDGVPAPLADDVGDSIKKGGEYVTPKSNMNMTPQVKASRDQGLTAFKRAQALIADGKITKEQAIQQLRAKGYVQLASHL